MKKCLSLAFLVLVLMVVNILVGSIHIPASDVLSILMGHTDGVRPSWVYIVLQSRLPQAMTAALAGGALAASGLMLQTAFRNPLADPGIFGISSGAGLGVALVMLFLGAMAVMVVIFFFSGLVRSSVMLLIVGIMIGYVSSSAVTLLNFFATDEGVKSYMVWGMGSFGGVSMRMMPAYAVVTLLALFCALLLIKPLNALMLGERYAENLGVNVVRVRNWLLIVTGLLTAVVTAFCGPISFIGLAVPHVARLLLTTDNHRTLLPATILMGSVTALVCNLLCVIPGEGGVIPLNAVTPLLGAPVIIYVIMKHKG